MKLSRDRETVKTATPENIKRSRAFFSHVFHSFLALGPLNSSAMVISLELSENIYAMACDGNFSFLFIIWKIQSENDKSRYEVKIHVSVESFASFRLELAGVENSVQFSLYFGCRVFPLIFHLGSSAAVSRQRKEKLKWKLGKFVQFLWIFHLRDYEWASKKRWKIFSFISEKLRFFSSSSSSHTKTTRSHINFPESKANHHRAESLRQNSQQL